MSSIFFAEKSSKSGISSLRTTIPKVGLHRLILLQNGKIPKSWTPPSQMTLNLSYATVWICTCVSLISLSATSISILYWRAATLCGSCAWSLTHSNCSEVYTPCHHKSEYPLDLQKSTFNQEWIVASGCRVTRTKRPPGKTECRNRNLEGPVILKAKRSPLKSNHI